MPTGKPGAVSPFSKARAALTGPEREAVRAYFREWYEEHKYEVRRRKRDQMRAYRAAKRQRRAAAVGDDAR